MAKKDILREKLIEAAREIFSKYGYKHTTLNEIAKAVGKKKSTFYYYFPYKEDIYSAVIEKESAILHDAVTEAVSKVDDPIEKLKKYVTARMLTFQATVNFYEAIRSELLAHLDFINQIRNKYDKEEIEMVEGFLKEGVHRKLFDIDNTNLAAIAIVTVMRGLEIPLVRYNSQRMFDERIDNLLRIMFYGIVKR